MAATDPGAGQSSKLAQKQHGASLKHPRTDPHESPHTGVRNSWLLLALPFPQTRHDLLLRRSRA